MDVGYRSRRSLAELLLISLLAIPVEVAGAGSFSELVKQGFEMMQSRRFEEAAESFGAALKVEPASEPARKGLAGAWAALGSSHLHAGRLKQSREYLERAVAAQPESAKVPPDAGTGPVP